LWEIADRDKLVREARGNEGYLKRAGFQKENPNIFVDHHTEGPSEGGKKGIHLVEGLRAE